jgi:hypothetical protein
MKHFSKLYELAARRKGGEAALEALIPKPKSAAALERTVRRRPGSRAWLCREVLRALPVNRVHRSAG